MIDTTAPDRVRSLPTLHQAIRAVGEMDARRASIRLKQAKAVEKLRARDADELATLDAAIADQMDKVGRYIGGCIPAFFYDGKRTMMTEAGEVALRALPVQVLVHDEAAAIDESRAIGDGDTYIRTKTNLDLRALAKDRPILEGIEYVENREQLVITPITSGEKIAVQL